MDVVSIKEEPAKLMRELLPPDVEILATHRLFGPQRAAAGLSGANVTLCPVRGAKWRRVAVILRRAGLRVMCMSPQEHDRPAAVGQAVVHLLAQAMRDVELQRSVTTRSFDLLMSARELLHDDRPEVVDAVLQGNPFAKSVALKLAAGIEQLVSQEFDPDTRYPNCPDDGRFSKERCASHPARCGAAHSNAGRDSAPTFQDRMQDRPMGSDGSGPAP